MLCIGPKCLPDTGAVDIKLKYYTLCGRLQLTLLLPQSEAVAISKHFPKAAARAVVSSELMLLGYE